jgi:ATP-binding cassette subfamily C protein
LAWARRDVSEEEMWRVLKLAAAEDLVRRLPNGLDTIVGDRGAFLSHGERQRLAIARALLRKPALLVLDEATNSLDSENEERVLEAIDNLHGNLTMLLIAHRFSTLKRADLVYVIEQGKIVASGTWESLASRRDGLEYHDENKLSESVRPTIRQ